MKNPTPLDHLADFVANAVTDVREKLVDEAWFGRLTAPQERVSQEVSAFIDRHQPLEPAGGVVYDDRLGQFVTRGAGDATSAADRDGGTREIFVTSAPHNWQTVCAQLTPDRSAEPQRDIEHERDR